jgi:hydrogenase maturation protein HypF
MMNSAVRITVHGIVQGVGFRPFVYRLAHAEQVNGTVANTVEGVIIELVGLPIQLESFINSLKDKAPPVSRITSLKIEDGSLQTDNSSPTSFTILASDPNGRANTQIAPDIALCPDCLAELNDPADRRFCYPFINCTNCGPRFTIVEKVPYDRPNTSMKLFPLCGRCRKEYEDPLDRRFHAQPNACPACGPSLSWHDRTGEQPVSENLSCIAAAVQALAAGKIVAIRGLGGFHLAVDALAEQAIALLRQRKQRREKPLAIMVRDIAAVRQFCLLSDREAEILLSPQHPIVLLPKKNSAAVAANLAPGIAEIGVMLPYTPVHHLLLNHAGAPAALVMTSGNLSNEPICIGNQEALERLKDIADFFLLHNREIITRMDDSVVRVMAGKARLLRRSRGYAPVPLQFTSPCADILACGAEMKNSFCLVRSNEAFISQHIGELTSSEGMDFFVESVDHLCRILDTDPPNTACDLHPDYLSSRYGQQRAVKMGRQPVSVQHHHAHAAAVMAEHGLDEPVLAAILDGSGYSVDGTMYGGEIFLADRHGFTRHGHLLEIMLPGGDRAAREPWRMGLSLLHSRLGNVNVEDAIFAAGIGSIDDNKAAMVGEMMEKGINVPLTSSCGRLFDGVAALLGTRLFTDYEGQAAMELEHLAATAVSGFHPPQQCYQPSLIRSNRKWVIDSRPLTGWIIQDLRNRTAINGIALCFHNWLISSVSRLLIRLGKELAVNRVVLGGGSFQNKLLLEGVFQQLTEQNMQVYSGEQVPVNDGGIAVGQAYIGGV